MLKDITLGQYFPGNSVIHRLDPRTKLLGLILYIVALFVADGWAYKRDSAIDSPVIYGVRAETSNPYHLVCIEHLAVFDYSTHTY